MSGPVLDADSAALDGFPDPLVALRLQLKGELASAGPDDAAVQQDVNIVRRDVVEDSLVVGDDYDRLLRAAERVDPRGHDLQGVDIQPRVRLVEEREPGVEDRH